LAALDDLHADIDCAQPDLQIRAVKTPLRLPVALKNMLAANPAVRVAFTKLPRSHRKEYADWIAEANRAETVERRLKQLVSMLFKKQALRT
jgi:uncharacterized protein YdeI (YjbR/CyaY-like superfamily)